MPRVGYVEEYKTATSTDFPALKLAVAEKARIWMPEEPWMEWVHRIEAPLIENGVAVKEVKQRKNGETYEATKMDWVGSPWCLGLTGSPGNPGPLMLAGIDPDNCPVCESAANGTGVQAPSQRFATNVIKFKVRPGTYDLITPVSAEILVWGYTARVYATLLEIQQQFGDLRKYDIRLELEDGKGADTWQRMKQISANVADGHAVAAYTDPKVRAYLQELWVGHPEYRATDDQLRSACKGRDVPRNVVMDMVRRAEQQWRQAQQAGTSDSGTAEAANGAFNGGSSLADGLESLIGGTPAVSSAEGHPPFDGLASPSAASQAPTTAVPPASQSAPPSADPLAGAFQEALDGARQHAAVIEQAAAVPTAAGATTTPTVAPAAESLFPTEQSAAPTASPASAPDGRQQAVMSAADALFAGDVPAAVPAPAAAPEQVVDFDDLFK